MEGQGDTSARPLIASGFSAGGGIVPYVFASAAPPPAMELAVDTSGSKLRASPCTAPPASGAAGHPAFHAPDAADDSIEGHGDTS